MQTENNKPQGSQQEAEDNSTEGLKNKSPEEQARFQQGGQQPGNSQGGQGGNQTSHEGENPRHDKGNELSEFAHEDS